MSSTVIAGKPSNTVGEKDSVLILRGSSVRVLWGNKFIDLIKNGKVNAEYDKLLKTADSVDTIKGDGIYLIEDQVWLVLNGTKVLLAGDKSTVYVSFVESLEITEENKLIALKNIGFYYNTIEEALLAGLLSGIIYILGDNKLYTIINGLFLEYGYNNSKENVEASLQKMLYINQYSLYVDGEEYILLRNNEIIANKKLTTANGIYSIDFKENQGYGLYIKNGESYLEVDNIIERNSKNEDSIYEFIKLYSEHSNIINSTKLNDTDAECELQEFNEFVLDDYIYIIGSVNVTDSFKNGLIEIIIDKESSLDIKGFLNGKPLIIPSGTTKFYISGNNDYELILIPEKELFEYRIKKSDKQTIIVENIDNVFLQNCKYVYKSRRPLLKIYKNNLVSLDRSIYIEGEPDKTEHTRIGLVKEKEIEQLKDSFVELEDRPEVGIFSDNFIGLNPFLYNSVFKSIRKDKKTNHPKYPIYDEKIDLPKDKLLIDDKFNYSVPDIEWIKKMMDLWIPIGTIVMWYGSMEDIPPGWAICNGDLGTPNLIGRFIKADYTTGKIDPEGVIVDKDVNKFKIEEEHLPYHTHPHTHDVDVITYSKKKTASSGNNSDVPDISNNSIETYAENESEKTWKNNPITIEPKSFKLIFIMKVSNWYNNIK